MIVRLLADGTLVLILGIVFVVGVVWWIRQTSQVRSKILPVVIMAGLTSLLVAKLVSLIYQPSIVRPFLEKGMTAGAAYIDNPGFPSDHVLLATVAVAAVWWVTRNKKLTLILATLVIVMGIARVLALVHTPLDVIGGLVFGLVGAVWYRKLDKKA